MPENKKQIKERIIATKKTGQITSAMNMVSSAKLRRSERSLMKFRPISDSIKETMASLLKSNPDITHKTLSLNEGKECFLILSTDRGLAGSYNNSLFKFFELFLKENNINKENIFIATIGIKAFSYFKKKGYNLINNEPINIRDDVLFVDYEDLLVKLVEGYAKGEIGRTTILYNAYKNSMECVQSLATLLPIDVKSERVENVSEYIFEPNIDQVLDSLIYLDVSYTMHRIILEAKSSEHASRMNSMKNASDNAEEIASRLTLLYNRARQTQITTELIDIVNGSSAV